MHSFLISLQNINPIAFRVGPFGVHWYGLAYAFGFLVAIGLIRIFSKRWKLSLTTDNLLTVMLYAIISVVIGGRLGYCLFYGGGYYFLHPLQVFATWDGGMSFHGGFIGIIIGLYLASRSIRIPFWTLADLASIGAPVGFGLGRIANFINGELWGRVTTSSLGVVFANAGSQPRYPTQLLEAVLEGLVLLLIMIVLASKIPPRVQGELSGYLTLFYGLFRIFIEFWREPDVGIGFVAGNWLTMGMLLSAPMVVVGIALIIKSRKSARPQGEMVR
ncbi:MAG: prolipoprotein diacylglyceryl transferase [Coriobacteriia bacterium]|nr:prolipoprotein diacylglyceryl transferase [Coriobacteriia bacterium]